jgi:hypothetical protein
MAFCRICLISPSGNIPSRAWIIPSGVDISSPLLQYPAARAANVASNFSRDRWSFIQVATRTALVEVPVSCGYQQSLVERTNSDKIGKIFGGTTDNPSSLPVISESWAPKACFDFGVGVKGLPAPSRAPPKKKGIISTETPCALRRSRNRVVFVNPNHEYGETNGAVSMGFMSRCG